MRRLLVALTIGASLCVMTPSAAQSLADLARTAEAARKATAHRPAKVYTNKDLTPAEPQPPASPPETKPVTSAPVTASDRTVAPSTPPAKTLPPSSKDEAYWRDRMRPLRERLDRARALADNTKRQADQLMGAADRCFQIGVVCADYTESLRLREEHKSLAADVARAERDVAALEEEGRKAGAPPGWLRP